MVMFVEKTLSQFEWWNGFDVFDAENEWFKKFK